MALGRVLWQIRGCNSRRCLASGSLKGIWAVNLYVCHEWSPPLLFAFVPLSFLQTWWGPWDFYFLSAQKWKGAHASGGQGPRNNCAAFHLRQIPYGSPGGTQQDWDQSSTIVTCSLMHSLFSFLFPTTSLPLHITLQINYSQADLTSESAFWGAQKNTSEKLSALGSQHFFGVRVRAP